MRLPEACAIVSITKIIESIIRLMRICMEYVIMLVRLPTPRYVPPDVTMSFAAKYEMRIIDVYTQNCMAGELSARIFSALRKSFRTESDAAENFSVS